MQLEIAEKTFQNEILVKDTNAQIIFLFVLGIAAYVYWTCTEVSRVLHPAGDHEYHGRKVSYTADLQAGKKSSCNGNTLYTHTGFVGFFK